MVLLSIKTGMRACEIANLDSSMVLDAPGKISDTLAIRDAISKKGLDGAFHRTPTSEGR
jgi:hypothetical protein